MHPCLDPADNPVPTWLRSPSRSQHHLCPHRTCPGRPALIIIAITVALAYSLGLLTGATSTPPQAEETLSEPKASRRVTLSPNCFTAPDLARAVGYPGDWRNLMAETIRLNPRLDWGHLHAGDQVRLPTP